MAENKKGVLVYTDWIHVFESLKDAEAGKLIKHFFRYVNDQNPEPPDKLTKICFEPIKQSLKRDLVKWEKTKEKLSEAGKKSAEKREEIKKNSTSVNQVQPGSTFSTVIDSVTVNDTVSVTVTDIPKQPPASADFDAFLFSFNSITGKNFRYSKKRQSALRARLADGFTLEQIAKAVSNCFNTEHHRTYPHYLTPDFILRQDKLEMYINYSKPIFNDNSKRTATTSLPSSRIVTGGKDPGKLREYRTYGAGS